jgi:hypothetical protein
MLLSKNLRSGEENNAYNSSEGYWVPIIGCLVIYRKIQDKVNDKKCRINLVEGLLVKYSMQPELSRHCGGCKVVQRLT